ncbi:MAG: DUF5667 domain-containing protein [Chloroflexi bacterium]|nr:DUF5667 domain-containing protein [Chloroflexota bacterium]
MGGNKQFNAILDECLERLLTGHETVEQCLQRYPEYVAELEPLLRTAVMMNKAVDVKPSADFRARARFQFQSVMAESKSPGRAAVFVPRWAVAVCAVLLVFVLGGGTVVAADGSMPGSPLYPVKLVAENVRVSLAGSEEKKAELYAAFADRRITELDYLVTNGKSANMEAVAQRLSRHYTMMGELPLAQGTEVVATSSPPTPMLGTSGISGGDTTEQGVVAAGNKSVSDSSVNGRGELKKLLGYYAVTQPQRLQQLLDSNKVPEAAKPALRRALWASEHGYQQVLDNLDK